MTEHTNLENEQAAYDDVAARNKFIELVKEFVDSKNDDKLHSFIVVYANSEGKAETFTNLNREDRVSILVSILLQEGGDNITETEVNTTEQ